MKIPLMSPGYRDFGSPKLGDHYFWIIMTPPLWGGHWTITPPQWGGHYDPKIRVTQVWQIDDFWVTFEKIAPSLWGGDFPKSHPRF